MKIENKLEQMLETVEVWDRRNLHKYIYYLYTLKEEGHKREFYYYESKLHEAYAITMSSCCFNNDLKGGD